MVDQGRLPVVLDAVNRDRQRRGHRDLSWAVPPSSGDVGDQVNTPTPPLMAEAMRCAGRHGAWPTAQAASWGCDSFTVSSPRRLNLPENCPDPGKLPGNESSADLTSLR